MKNVRIQFVFEDDDKESGFLSIEVDDMVQLIDIIEGLKEEAEDNQVHISVEAIDFKFSDEEIKYLTENNIHTSYL